MLSFFPRGVLDEILNLVESVSEDFSSYSSSFFNVASYSHANECSGRYTVFETTVICCEFFFVESCLLSVQLSCVYYLMFYNLHCREGP